MADAPQNSSSLGVRCCHPPNFFSFGVEENHRTDDFLSSRITIEASHRERVVTAIHMTAFENDNTLDAV